MQVQNTGTSSRKGAMLQSSSTALAYERIQDWDLTDVKDRLIKEGIYTPDEVNSVETDYKRYIALCVGNDGEAFPTPLGLDPMWHQHILFTKDYAAMCQHVAGRFIHHSPFVDGERPDPQGRDRLYEAYRREFGSEPGHLWAGCQGPSKGCTACGAGT